ncbi:hypothetical protein [Flavobacterium sp. JP2137]|uniref:hypothetical protein n=1 Tax=Flavobacterium sp. JP2137 TaxID=3414510 RepID=UPI003D2FAE05
MSQQPTSPNQEIDIVYIYRALGKMCTNIGLFFYNFLLLLKRNILIIAALLLVGIGLGYYLDSREQQLFRHDFIVVPNFGSVDYLYEAFDNNSYITTNLNSQEWANLKEVKRIKIEPVEDVYTLIKTNRYAMDLFKVLNDRGGDLGEFLKNESTRKNFKYHLLSIYTRGTNNTDQVTAEVFDQLNSQEYYLKKQAIAQAQNEIRKVQTQRSLEQMNSLLDQLGKAPSSSDAKMISIQNLPEVENLFYRKNNIMEDLAMIEVEQMEQQKTVYIAGASMNIMDEKIWDKRAISLPFVLLVLFFVVVGMKNFTSKFKRIKASRTN